MSSTDSDRSSEVVVTASRRLARHLRLELATARQVDGVTAWLAPRFLPWDSWLTGLWEQGRFRGDFCDLTLLNSRQSAILWERVVRRALGEGSLANPRGLAVRTAEAWQRAANWGIEQAEIAAAARGPDADFFVRALRLFTSECERNRWQDPARLTSVLTERVLAGKLEVAGPLVFAGFERLTPAQCTLIEALSTCGTSCEFRRPESRRAAVRLETAVDRDAELLAAGAWARERLAARPDARIGIIVPGLGTDADRVRRLVAEGLAPGWQLRGEHPTMVNVSYGRPLAAYGLVDTALCLLRLIVEDPDFIALSRLLRSPFLARWDTGARAAAEVGLRELPDRHWKPADAAAALGCGETAAEFLGRLQALIELRESWTARALPAEWASRIADLLADLGWAEEHSPDSATWQLVNAWRSLLNQFASTGAVTGPVSGIAAVRQLSAAAADTLFQPEGPEQAVQVMGMLEASGLSFDALRLTGLDTTTWPPPQRPDPLLPIGLQRDRGMPDATPDDTLEYARGIFDGLLAAAPEVVISWPRAEGEALLTPSPFLADLGESREAEGRAPYAAELAGCATLDLLARDSPPPVAPAESIPGGHGILTAQRTQPFDAFAGFRLGAAVLETPVAGLSGRDRGIVIHRTLETVYRRWSDQASLAAAAPEQRAQVVREAAERAIGRYRRGCDPRLRAILELETGRCAELVERFLEVDLARPVFGPVLCEEAREVQVGPLTLHIRPDRVDSVPGGWLVIDYKTGATGTAVGDDPDDPRQLQLVVYAMSQTGGAVRGLAVAAIHPHRTGYNGVRDAKLEWNGRALRAVDEWSGLLNAWRARAHALADAIGRGDARLNLTIGTEDQRGYAVLSRYTELIHDD